MCVCVCVCVCVCARARGGGGRGQGQWNLWTENIIYSFCAALVQRATFCESEMSYYALAAFFFLNKEQQNKSARQNQVNNNPVLG